ncbi:MAG: efflux RND transporter permease subunit [Myxococcales bacterium]|nr:efflux RND transporter permease subunit [Myxococcales bacterium]
MSLAEFSIKRPVLTIMMTLIIVLLGGVSWQRIQTNMLPDIDLPSITVATEYRGASPEVMERLVTQIVEEIVATVPGVVEIRSESAQGVSSVTVTFGWGTNIDVAALDLRSRLEDELSELPEDISRPQIRKFDIRSFPVVLLGIASKLDPVKLTELVENHIRHRFSRIPNIAQADLWGEYPREVRIELKLEQIKALNLSLNQVVSALKDANLDLPAGEIEQGRHRVVLRAPAEFSSLDEIRHTVVAVQDGALITIGQIATVNDTYQKLTRLARINGEQGLRIAIRKQADANTVEVSRLILQVVEELNKDFPQIKILPVFNQGNFIERSIKNVAWSVLYGGSLAFGVLLFFLLSLRSTLVVAVAIPISFLATFALMFFSGITINLMTLGGLALGVGMMVDSSIVVLENIFRRRDEAKEDVYRACVRGSGEVAGAVTASTITTLVVFLPLAFVQGISGLLFRELAYVVMFSLICSLIVSLSTLPMLASKLLNSVKTRTQDTHSSSNKISPGNSPSPRPVSVVIYAQQAFSKLNRTYLRIVEAALARPRLSTFGAYTLFVGSLFLIPTLGTEFLPPSDEGEVRIRGKTEIGTKLSLVDERMRALEAIVYPAVPEALSSVVSVGASGRRPEAASEGEMRLSLPPASERSRSNIEVAKDLRERLAGQIPGLDIRVQAPQGSFVLQAIFRTEDGLTVEVRGFDFELLELLAQQVAEQIVDIPGITDVEVSRDVGIPQQAIFIDRAKVADLGLSIRQVTEALSIAVAGAQAGEYRQGENSYRILVQLADIEKTPLDAILGLKLITASGAPVTLRNLVTSRPNTGPLLIERKDQQRLVTVNANIAGRDLGSVAADVQVQLDKIVLPGDYEIRLSGAFEEQQKAFGELLISLGLALLLVYMVLASQYESFKDPFIVMMSVPLATVGVVLMLLFTGTTLNVQSYIGCIMLGGIVVNNAILLVDQMTLLDRSGMPIRLAVIEAGRRRLRPILMTTLTTILGLAPLAMGIGEGADAQAPLARAVIGGLLGSTPITLVIIPVLYFLFHTREQPPGISYQQSVALAEYPKF